MYKSTFGLVVLILTLVLPSVGRASVSYGPLSDMNLSKGSTQNIETSIYPVTYRVYSYDTVDNRTEERLEAIISSSAALLRDYAANMGLPLNDCAGDQVIEFFIIPYSVLNDRSRFSEWPYENGISSSSSNIVALYSPRRTERNIDAILFTRNSLSMDHYVAHELAHYWYERLCWSSNTSVRTEPFAMGFESYYLSNYNSSYTYESTDNQSSYSDGVPTIRGRAEGSGSRSHSHSGSSYNDGIPTIRGGSGPGGGR